MLVSVSRRWSLVAVLLVAWSYADAQKSGGRSPGTTNSPTGTSAFVGPWPVYVSGDVVIEGAGSPPEPVAIDRVCKDLVRRVGYTDAKGNFQLDLTTIVEQDATENDSVNGQDLSNRPTVGLNDSRYQDCELVAVLPGFQSSSVIVGRNGFAQTRVGTIVLKRLSNVEGLTISMTSLAAPKDAHEAYDRGRKAREENKLDEAEKELAKAVELYPNYAVAWALLGEIQRVRNRPEDAVKDYRRAISCDAQFVTPYFGLAMIAVNQKRWQEAANLTDQMIRLNPYAYPTVYFYSAVANFQLKNFDVAERNGRKFQTLDSGRRHPDIAFVISDILADRGDYAGAAEQLRAYLSLSPTAANAGPLKARIAQLENLAATKAK